jgi:opacity protein-like surface antigen
MWNPKLAKIALLLALGASRVDAQEQPRVALDLGYPPALALLWGVSDRVALRPELSFSYSGGDQSATVWTVAPGVSALASMHPSGALTPYAGGRLAGLWIKEGTGPQEWLAGVVVGARYAIERHFGVSAETGMAYTHFRFRFGSAGNTVAFDSWNVAPTGRVSALWYF